MRDELIKFTDFLDDYPLASFSYGCREIDKYFEVEVFDFNSFDSFTQRDVIKYARELGLRKRKNCFLLYK